MPTLGPNLRAASVDPQQLIAEQSEVIRQHVASNEGLRQLTDTLKEANLELTLQVNELHAEVLRLLEGKNKAVLDLRSLAHAAFQLIGNAAAHPATNLRTVMVTDLRALQETARRVWSDEANRKCDGPD